MSQTQTQISQPIAEQPRTLDLELKKMIDAWVGFLIVSIVLSVIFQGGDNLFSVIPKFILFVHAVRLSIDYNNFKKSQKYGVHFVSPQSTHTASEVDSASKPQFCPMCGQTHEENSKFCAACGTPLE